MQYSILLSNIVYNHKNLINIILSLFMDWMWIQSSFSYFYSMLSVFPKEKQEREAPLHQPLPHHYNLLYPKTDHVCNFFIYLLAVQ